MERGAWTISDGDRVPAFQHPGRSECVGWIVEVGLVTGEMNRPALESLFCLAGGGSRVGCDRV